MANEKRLIDANELIERVAGMSDLKMNGVTIAVAIAKCPTVDAVEVVHGYWIDSTSVDHLGRIVEHSIDCSVCENVFKDDRRDVVKRWKERFKVCPFCGAKMDGDGNG